MEHSGSRYGLSAMRIAAALVAIAAATPSAASAACPRVGPEYSETQADLVFVPVQDERLAATVCYPERVFRRAEDGADGLYFVSDDGLAWFRLTHRENRERRSIRRVMDAAEERLEARGATVTYERVKDDWFVLSGYLGKRIYYQRSVLTRDGGAVDTLFIEFPQEQKPFYYDIVRRMSWSFKPR